MFVNKTNERTWKPTEHAGVSRALLRNNEEGGRTSLVHLEEGARVPSHVHHGTEEVVVMAGSVTIGGIPLQEGDYLFTTPGEEHDVVATTEATIFVSSEKATPVVE